MLFLHLDFVFINVFMECFRQKKTFICFGQKKDTIVKLLIACEYMTCHISYVYTYRKTFNISRILVGKSIVDNSDVVGASPAGAAPTTSSFST